jgi:molybdopterin biosynthesis enzyme MoaB
MMVIKKSVTAIRDGRYVTNLPKLENYITHGLQKVIKGHLFTCIVIPFFHAGLKI